MRADDNTVNTERRSSYHHGGLRAALIAEGMKLLTEKDIASVSLREVARRADVTATSVYRHFQDKEALLAALAMEGLAMLGASQRKAAAASASANAGFAATGIAYVEFAIANPTLFRLIFASTALRPERTGELSKTEPGILLLANAAAASDVGDDVELRAVRAWANVHGVAMLILDGHLPQNRALIEKLILASASG